MDFSYYPFPEHDTPIDDPETLIDWLAVDQSPEACVARGVAYLLATHPRAMLRIDIARVNVGSLADCPLGQIFGDFMDSPEYLKHDGPWLGAHGFTLSTAFDPANDAPWLALTEEWRRQLAAPGVLS